MKKIMQTLYIRGWVKIIGSLIGGAIVSAVLVYADDVEPVGRIVSGILFGGLIIWYLYRGVYSITTGKRSLKQAISNTGVTVDALDIEFQNAKCVCSAYFGTDHLFAVSGEEIVILDFQQIETLEIRHLGHNYAKMRSGYYLVCLKGQSFRKTIKLYAATREMAQGLIRELKATNHLIEEIE